MIGANDVGCRRIGSRDLSRALLHPIFGGRVQISLKDCLSVGHVSIRAILRPL